MIFQWIFHCKPFATKFTNEFGAILFCHMKLHIMSFETSFISKVLQTNFAFKGFLVHYLPVAGEQGSEWWATWREWCQVENQGSETGFNEKKQLVLRLLSDTRQYFQLISLYSCTWFGQRISELIPKIHFLKVNDYNLSSFWDESVNISFCVAIKSYDEALWLSCGIVMDIIPQKRHLIFL